jgi:hypothetical protein
VSREAALAIKEHRGGRERLAFKARRFDSGLVLDVLGDPIGGSTAYRLCIYDAVDRLVGRLQVDRAGQTCGSAGKACWNAIGDQGWVYRDPTASADGVRRLLAKGGRPGKGSIRLKAHNKARKDLTSLPVGIAAALETNQRATVQLTADDAGCVSALVERVRKADGAAFKAKTKPGSRAAPGEASLPSDPTSVRHRVVDPEPDAARDRS